jgi:hypothetical protein
MTTDTLVLSSEIPDEALEALRHLGWHELLGDYLIWDADRSAWRGPTKR